MAENDATVVSSGEDQEEKVVPLWLRQIASANFYSSCETHLSLERKFNCTVCMVALCKKCKKQHNRSGHKMIKAHKFGEEASFQMEDLKSLWNTSDIRPYTYSYGLVAFIYKRGAGIPRSQGESGDAVCESCQYQFRSPGVKYCSVECKVEALMKKNEDGSTKNGAKRKVELSEENDCNVQSSSKQPRK